MRLMQFTLACFLLAGVVSWVYCWRAQTPDEKLLRHRRSALALGTLFFLFVCSTVAAGERWSTVAIVGPAIAAVTWASVRFSHVCRHCGGLLFWPFGSRLYHICPYCREELRPS